MHDYKNDCTNGLRCILGGTDVPKMSNDASLEGQMYQWVMMHPWKDICINELRCILVRTDVPMGNDA